MLHYKQPITDCKMLNAQSHLLSASGFVTVGFDITRNPDPITIGETIYLN